MPRALLLSQSSSLVLLPKYYTYRTKYNIAERFKIQFAFIRQEHNMIYNHMNENKIRRETSIKEHKQPQ